MIIIFKIDLHVHSTHSDGHYSIPKLIKLASERNIKILSVTDHNTVSGVEEAINESKKHDIRIIPGTELATDFEEILGYFIDINNEEIKSLIKRHKKRAFEKIDLTVQRFIELGYPVTTEEVLSLAQNMGVEIPMRFHIIEVLISKGRINSVNEGLDYIYRSGLFEKTLSIPTGDMPTIKETIKAIINAGGVPIMAHPAYCRHFLTFKGNEIHAKSPSFIKKQFKKFASYGLAGCEGIYPINSNDEYPRRAKLQKTINSVVSSLGLLLTGGSDFHGENVVPDNILGNFSIKKETFDKLESLKNLKRTFCLKW